MGLPLPLPDRGCSAQESELAWYFTESRAEQSGIRSNQGAVERILECGLRTTGLNDTAVRLRQLRAIRRARRIERRLMAVPDDALTVLILAHRDDSRLRHLGKRGMLYCHLPCAEAAYKAAGAPLTLLDWLAMLADVVRLGVANKPEKRLVRQLRTSAERFYAAALEAYAATH